MFTFIALFKILANEKVLQPEAQLCQAVSYVARNSALHNLIDYLIANDQQNRAKKSETIGKVMRNTNFTNKRKSNHRAINSSQHQVFHNHILPSQRGCILPDQLTRFAEYI
jgi:hypothetical protein